MKEGHSNFLSDQPNKGKIMNASLITNSISQIKGTRFIGLDYTVDIKPSAANKDVIIYKTVSANVQVFSGLKEYTDVYSNAVKKSGQAIQENDTDKVKAFEKSDNWFEHTKFFSIVEKKSNPEEKYLYCIFNAVIQSEFFVDGKLSTIDEVSKYLTPGEAKKILQPNEVTYNKKNDVLHTVVCRTIAVKNITNVTGI